MPRATARMSRGTYRGQLRGISENSLHILVKFSPVKSASRFLNRFFSRCSSSAPLNDPVK